MSRTPDAYRKDELLQAAVQYVYRHGLSELSLRPLAKAIGASPRTLLYHFGSKEALIVEVLGTARREQEKMLSHWMNAQPDMDFEGILRQFWLWLSSSDNEDFLKLFFEVYGLALQGPQRFPNFFKESVTAWINVISASYTAKGLDPREAAVRATLVIGTIRGLLLDLLATGDRIRADEAFQAFLWSLKNPVSE